MSLEAFKIILFVTEFVSSTFNVFFKIEVIISISCNLIQGLVSLVKAKVRLLSNQQE